MEQILEIMLAATEMCKYSENITYLPHLRGILPPMCLEKRLLCAIPASPEKIIVPKTVKAWSCQATANTGGGIWEFSHHINLNPASENAHYCSFQTCPEHFCSSRVPLSIQTLSFTSEISVTASEFLTILFKPVLFSEYFEVTSVSVKWIILER